MAERDEVRAQELTKTWKTIQEQVQDLAKKAQDARTEKSGKSP